VERDAAKHGICEHRDAGDRCSSRQLGNPKTVSIVVSGLTLSEQTLTVVLLVGWMFVPIVMN
jgi:hypothetical protein